MWYASIKMMFLTIYYMRELRLRAIITNKLMSQSFTDFESQSQSERFDMPTSRKRQRTNSYGSRSPYSRRYPALRRGKLSNATRIGAGGNRAIIPLVCTDPFELTADKTREYTFDAGQFYVNNVGTAIPGFSDLASVFEYVRIAKIEFSILPAADSLQYSSQVLATGATNIPYVYTAMQYSGDITPTLSEMRQNPTVKYGLFNKVIKRTLYPRLDGANGVIDVSANHKDQFMHTAVTSTQRWRGFQMIIDMVTSTWTYGSGRLEMKLFFECMQSK